MSEKKQKKERSNKYEEKVHINTTLDDVLKVSIPKPKEKKEKE
tara:strand:+ start:6625 stop:6753 length:129 start_codon:yes stop_codon:yes gene_type:complete